MATVVVNYSGDGFVVNGITASGSGTIASAGVIGGTYGIITNAGTWGTGGIIAVQIKGASTGGQWQNVITPGTSANSYGTVSIPPAQLQVTTAGTVTDGAVIVARIPTRGP